ncbi:kinase- mitochondrial [Apiospora arundinis]
MPMTGQLPHGAEGPAALSIIFALASLTCSITLIWLAWSHNARLSYIACVAFCTLISTTTSIIQQIHVIGWYRDVVTDQFEAKLANPDSPDNAIANGSTGMDLVLFYIQFYCYNVESMFVLFWAAELGQSVYGLTQKYRLEMKLQYFNLAAKAIAVLLPLLLVALLRAPAIQNDTAASIALADLPLWLSIGLGSIIMLAILGRYIYTQRILLRFDPQRSASTDPSSSPTSRRRRPFTRLWCKYIYDRWVMTRFFVAFVRLALFQVTVTVFQQFATSGTKGFGNAVAVASSPATDGPDFSVERAKMSMYFFIPGNTPGIALMIIFGTTATFRHHMYKTFVPRRFQKCAMKLPLHGDCGNKNNDNNDNNKELYPVDTATTNSSVMKPIPRNNTATPVPRCPKRALLKQVSFRSDTAMSSIRSPTSLNSPTPLLRTESAASSRSCAPTPPPANRSKSVSFRSEVDMSPPIMHTPTPLVRSQSARIARRTPPPPATRFRSNTAMSQHRGGMRSPTPRPDLMKTLPERPPPSASSMSMSNPMDGLSPNTMGPGVETEWHEDSAAFIIRRIEARHGVRIDPGSRGGLI